MVKIDDLDGKKPVGIPSQNDSDRFDKVVVEAIRGNNTNLLKQLYSQDPNIDGSKYLKEAASEGRIDCVKILAEWQIDETGAGLALASAAEHGHNAIVEFIMTTFSDISEDHLRCAISSALGNRHTHTVQIIENAKRSSSNSNSLWGDDDDLFGFSEKLDDPLGASRVNDEFNSCDEPSKISKAESLETNSDAAPSTPPMDNAFPSAPPRSPDKLETRVNIDVMESLPSFNPSAFSVTDATSSNSASNQTETKKEKPEAKEPVMITMSEEALKRLITECLNQKNDSTPTTLQFADPLQKQPQVIATSKSIHEAAATGDVAHIKYLTSNSNIKVESFNAEGLTPLMVAAQQKQLAAMKVLIELGNGINTFSKNRQTTVLMNALIGGSIECFKLLTDRKVDVNARTQQRITALMAAAELNRLKEAKILINKGATVNDVDSYGDTAVFFAARRGHAEMIKLLAKNRANVNQVNSKSETPLFQAVRWNQLSCIGMLAVCDADFYYHEQNGPCSLYSVVSSAECIHKLDRSGLVINSAAIDYAIAHNDLNLLKKIAPKCAELKGPYGAEKLVVAVKHGLSNIIDILLDAQVAVPRKAYFNCNNPQMKQRILQCSRRNGGYYQEKGKDDCAVM